MREFITLSEYIQLGAPQGLVGQWLKVKSWGMEDSSEAHNALIIGALYTLHEPTTSLQVHELFVLYTNKLQHTAEAAGAKLSNDLCITPYVLISNDRETRLANMNFNNKDVSLVVSTPICGLVDYVTPGVITKLMNPEIKYTKLFSCEGSTTAYAYLETGYSMTTEVEMLVPKWSNSK